MEKEKTIKWKTIMVYFGIDLWYVSDVLENFGVRHVSEGLMFFPHWTFYDSAVAKESVQGMAFRLSLWNCFAEL